MVAPESEVVHLQPHPIHVLAGQYTTAHPKDFGQSDYITLPDEPHPPARGWVFHALHESSHVLLLAHDPIDLPAAQVIAPPILLGFLVQVSARLRIGCELVMPITVVVCIPARGWERLPSVQGFVRDDSDLAIAVCEDILREISIFLEIEIGFDSA